MINDSTIDSTVSEPASGSRISLWLQYVGPHKLACWLMYRLTRARFKTWKNWQIRWFIRRYRVDMREAVLKHREDFADFNSFFTRELQPGARPLPAAADEIACPADGAVAAFGQIRQGRLIQAKQHDYSLQALLGGDNELAGKFQDGHYLTVYLAPRDYHRVHMPYAGKLIRCLYIAGKRFAVNAQTAAAVKGLYARNERVVAIFDTDRGAMAVILVGAMFVGSIDTVWPHSSWQQPGQSGDLTNQPELALGDEMGRFNMGSTVIVLFAPGMLQLHDALTFGQGIRMGETIGTLN